MPPDAGDETARQLTRGQIQDAITAWRDGATFDAIHPLAHGDDWPPGIFWDDNAMKDLARVIYHTIQGGREIPVADLPWGSP